MSLQREDYIKTLEADIIEMERTNKRILAALKGYRRFEESTDQAVQRLRESHDALLAALKALAECHAEGGFVQPDDDVLDAARAAIAAAEGEQARPG